MCSQYLLVPSALHRRNAAKVVAVRVAIVGLVLTSATQKPASLPVMQRQNVAVSHSDKQKLSLLRFLEA